jgi:tetratricopeptide (TPR) repeat protein
LFTNFEQIDPERIYYADGFEPFGSYRSAPFGYSIDLKQTKWLRWKHLEKSFPDADTGCKQGHLYAFIMPIYYGDEKPGMDALTKVLFQDAEYAYPVDGSGKEKPIHESNMEGRLISYLQNHKGTEYDVRCKILSGPRSGYLLSAWTKNNQPGKDDLFGQFFNNVHFGATALQNPEIDKLSDTQKEKQSRLINKLGLFYFNGKQYNKSLAYFQLAHSLNIANKHYIINCLNAYNRIGGNEAALEFLAKLGDRSLVDNDILSWKAWYLKSSKKTNEALAIYDKLFSGNYRNEEDFLIYTQLLFDKQQFDKLDKAYETYLKDNDSIDIRLNQIKLLQKRGKHQEAIQKLKAWQKNRPFDSKIAYALIHSYAALGEHRDALATADDLIDKGYATADAYYYKAEAEYRLKWFNKAKQSLEKAAAIAPNDEDIKAFLKQISALLGQGSNSQVKEPIEAVPLPKAIAEKLPPIDAKPADNGFDSYYLSIVKGFSFKKGRTFKQTTYQRIKVQNAGGVSRFSTLEIDFNPVSERLFVNSLIIKDQHGKIISRGNLSNYYVTDKNSGEMATHDQTLHIPVPELAAGYTIELVSTKESLSQYTRTPFERVYFGASRPVLLSAVFYSGDPEAVQRKTINAPAPIQMKNGLAWILKNPAVYQREPYALNFETQVPSAVIGGAGQTWAQVAENYMEKIKDRLRMDAMTRHLAIQLVKHAGSDPKDRVNALADHVQTGYTYKAIEFGSRGQIPDAAATTIKNKYGDCKDHALLLHQLLKAVGITSYLALVSTDYAIEPSIPSLDQFNHMIVYVPDKGNGHFIDTTDKDQNLRLTVPTGLAGCTALILDEKKGHLAKIPAYADNSCVKSQRDIEVVDKKDLRITEKIVMTGYIAGFMRHHLKTIESAHYLRWSQELISYYQSSARVLSFNLSHLFENTKELILDVTYTIPRYCISSDNDFSFKIPGIWEKYYLEVTPVPERKTAFQISYPFIFQSDIIIKGPKGYTLDPERSTVSENKQSFVASWRNQMKPFDGGQELSFSCNLKPGVYSPGKYHTFHILLDDAISSLTRELHYVRDSAKMHPEVLHHWSSSQQ